MFCIILLKCYIKKFNPRIIPRPSLIFTIFKDFDNTEEISTYNVLQITMYFYVRFCLDKIFRRVITINLCSLRRNVDFRCILYKYHTIRKFMVLAQIFVDLFDSILFGQSLLFRFGASRVILTIRS